MADEQKLVQTLEATFPALAGKITVARPRRMFVDAPAESFRRDHYVPQEGAGLLPLLHHHRD